jgi:hypothetical protein
MEVLPHIRDVATQTLSCTGLNGGSSAFDGLVPSSAGGRDDKLPRLVLSEEAQRFFTEAVDWGLQPNLIVGERPG